MRSLIPEKTLMQYQCIKNGVIRAAVMLGADALFRRINRKKLLVVMYHGVTGKDYEPQIWTQLPLAAFRRQLEFLCDCYVPVSLNEVVRAIRGQATLPERAVLITFDDGLKNNYTIAFPVLHEMGVPAAIFLAVDYVGSGEILWVDELYFLLLEASLRGISLDLPYASAQDLLLAGQLQKSYEIAVEALKRTGAVQRAKEMERLRAMIPLDRRNLLDDFSMLSWDDVHIMLRSGRIEFGVHTATHRILTELAGDEWEQEIIVPKHNLESKLDREVAAFCFPNGRPLIDFRPEHIEYLRKSDYSCAFTTERGLFALPDGDCMAIARIAGHEGKDGPAYFRLNASGAIRFVKDSLNRVNAKEQAIMAGAS